MAAFGPVVGEMQRSAVRTLGRRCATEIELHLAEHAERTAGVRAARVQRDLDAVNQQMAKRAAQAEEATK